MNSDVIQGKWKQMTGDVKKFFGKLTDDDLQQVEGNSEKLLGKLQERYGYTREQAETEWSKFSNQHRDMFNKAGNDIENAANKMRNDANSAVQDLNKKTNR